MTWKIHNQFPAVVYDDAENVKPAELQFIFSFLLISNGLDDYRKPPWCKSLAFSLMGAICFIEFDSLDTHVTIKYTYTRLLHLNWDCVNIDNSCRKDYCSETYLKATLLELNGLGVSAADIYNISWCQCARRLVDQHRVVALIDIQPPTTKLYFSPFVIG